MYQRKKGRDLFDLYMALKSGMLTAERAIKCFKQYMDFLGYRIPSMIEYANNLDEKMLDPNFRVDIIPFLAQNIEYNADEACEVVKEQLLRYL